MFRRFRHPFFFPLILTLISVREKKKARENDPSIKNLQKPGAENEIVGICSKKKKGGGRTAGNIFLNLKTSIKIFPTPSLFRRCTRHNPSLTTISGRQHPEEGKEGGEGEVTAKISRRRSSLSFIANINI